MAAQTKVTVPVKSPFTSKVNLFAGIGGLLTTISGLGAQIVPFLPAQYHVYGTAALAIITALATIWARTFPAPSALSPSVGK